MENKGSELNIRSGKFLYNLLKTNINNLKKELKKNNIDNKDQLETDLTDCILLYMSIKGIVKRGVGSIHFFTKRDIDIEKYNNGTLEYKLS